MKKQMMFRTVVDVPQLDFQVQPCEKILLVGSCFADHIGQCLRREAFPVTVSPIRYAKYGYHGSALSKATLLLAADRLVKAFPQQVSYFPAYEIVNDELRDYRFYAPDMLHPSQQAVEYIWQRLVDSCFSEEAKQYMDEWQPLREALGHRPFDAESDAYRAFRAATLEKVRLMQKKYPAMQIDFETKE